MNTVVRNVLWLTIFLFGPASAYALDSEFITHEGFSQTVNAFRVLSLIFNDNQFKVLVGTFAVIGLMGGGFVAFFRAVFAGGQTPATAVGWLFMPLLGAVFFQALVLPKGKIHIYDKTLNKYEDVGGIPNLLVMVAGGLNGIEEGLRKIISKNSASVHAKDVNEVSFRLLYNTMMGVSRTIPTRYTNSIKRFYKDCMPISNAVDKHFDLDRLLRDTDSIFSELQHLWHPSVYTVYYGDNRVGDTLSCSDARNKLFTWVNGSTFKESFDAICKRQGLNSPEQIPTCKKEISKGATFLFNRPVSADNMVRNAVFASSIARYLTETNPDIQVGAYSNRRMINSGIATSMASQTWMPTIKATVTAVVLALTPVLIMFFVTPYFTKVLAVVISLFAWLAVWGVCDAILHQSAIDQMISAFEGVRANKMGLWALWTAPSAAMKALAIIGQSRSMAMNIAAFIGAAIFGMNAYALSGMGMGLARRAEQEGINAAEQTQNPQRVADEMSSLANANAVSEVGMDGLNARARFSMGRDTAQAAMASAGLGGGPLEAGMQLGAADVGSQVGRTRALGEQARGGETIADVAARTAQTTTGMSVTGAEAQEEAARELGFSNAAEFHGRSARIGALRQMGEADVNEQLAQEIHERRPMLNEREIWRNMSMLNHGARQSANIEATGGDPSKLQSTYAQQTREEIGAAEGRGEAAVLSHVSPERIAKQTAMFSSLTQNARNDLISRTASDFGMSDKELITAQVGHGFFQVALNKDQFKHAYEKGKIDPLAWEKYKDTGVVMTASIAATGDLMNVSYSDNISYSKTMRNDTSLSLGNPDSARRELTNKHDVAAIRRQYGVEARKVLPSAAASSMEGVASISSTETKHMGGSVGGTASAGVGHFGVKASAELGKNVSDSTTKNRFLGDFQRLYDVANSVAETESKKIDWSDKGKTEKERNLKREEWQIDRFSEIFAGGQQAMVDYYSDAAAKNNVSLDSLKEQGQLALEVGREIMPGWAKDKLGINKESNPETLHPLERYFKESLNQTASQAFKSGKPYVNK